MVNKLTSGGVMTIRAELWDFDHPPPPTSMEGDTGSVKRKHSESKMKEQNRGSSESGRSGNDLKSK